MNVEHATRDPRFELGLWRSGLAVNARSVGALLSAASALHELPAEYRELVHGLRSILREHIQWMDDVLLRQHSIVERAVKVFRKAYEVGFLRELREELADADSTTEEHARLLTANSIVQREMPDLGEKVQEFAREFHTKRISWNARIDIAITEVEQASESDPVVRALVNATVIDEDDVDWPDADQEPGEERCSLEQIKLELRL